MVDESIKARARELVLANGLCVLATSGPDGPYLSLMSYLAKDDGETIHLLTQRGSRKHRNLMADSRMSLLIDDRESQGRERGGQVTALSISGRAQEVADPKTAVDILARLVKRHPDLANLAKGPDLAVLEVTPQAWLLLEGPQRAHRW